MSENDSVVVFLYDRFETNKRGEPENVRRKFPGWGVLCHGYKGLNRAKMDRKYPDLTITSLPRLATLHQTDGELVRLLFGGETYEKTEEVRVNGST